MSSFGLLLFLFVAAHPQKSATAHMAQKVQTSPLLQLSDDQKRQTAEASQSPTCYTIRSYRFHQQDGRAPVPAGMTTCTPANILQQRRVSHGPDSLFVPLGLNDSGKKISEQNTSPEK